jgi:hypothetical protein
MTDHPGEIVSANALANFTYVAAPDMPLVSTRPQKINLATIQGLLEPGEKLLSWGTLPGSTYFAFDEHLLRMVFLSLVLTAYSFSLGPHFIWFLHTHAPWLNFNDWLKCLLFCFLGWLCWSRVRKASYVITSRRLMRIGQFVHSFDLAAFERAVQHKDEGGTTFIELWTRDGEGPGLILELGLEPQAIVAMFPLAIESQDGAPNLLPPAPPLD